MKTKPIPAIVMLLAGFVTCIMSIYNRLNLKTFTKTLLLVLIIFYLFGVIIKIVLDKNFVMAEDKEEEIDPEIEDKVEESQEEEPELKEE